VIKRDSVGELGTLQELSDEFRTLPQASRAMQEFRLSVTAWVPIDAGQCCRVKIGIKLRHEDRGFVIFHISPEFQMRSWPAFCSDDCLANTRPVLRPINDEVFPFRVNKGKYQKKQEQNGRHQAQEACRAGR
jgi:hypothetical protein